MLNSTERQTVDELRRTFGHEQLPESLVRRLAEIGSAAPETLRESSPGSDESKGSSRRRWSGPAVLVAAAVAAIAVAGAVIGFPGGGAPMDSAISQSPSATASAPVLSESAPADSPTSSSDSSVTVATCGQIWTTPVNTLPLKVVPEWPAVLKSEAETPMTVQVTNLDTHPVLLTGPWWFVILLDQQRRVVTTVTDAALVLRPGIRVPPNQTITRQIAIPWAGTCDVDNPQPLTPGTYTAIYIEGSTTKLAVSDEATVVVSDR